MIGFDNFGLRPAETSEYFRLATLHSTPDACRRAWNLWASSNLSPAEREQLRNEGVDGVPAEVSLEELASVAELLSERSATRFLSGRPSLPSPEHIDFSNLYISTALNLSGYLFPSDLRLDRSQCAHILLSDAVCMRGLSIKEANVKPAVVANGIRVRHTFNVSHSKIQILVMREARVGELSADRLACDYVSLSGAEFAGAVSFSSAKLGDLLANDVSVARSANFSHAGFRRQASYVNAQLNGVTRFVGARFSSEGPDFRGARLHDATEWHDAEWPLPPDGRDQAHQQIYAYERLKQEMERLKKHEDEQFFYRKELRARRALNAAGSPTWLLNWLYDATSSYGHSIVRPLGWMFAIWILGTAMFENAAIHAGQPLPLVEAKGFSFANLFVLLPLKRDLMAAFDPAGFSWLFHAVASVQAISGTALLFLIGLALRNRFRMR